MDKTDKKEKESIVDTSLVTMFLRMSPEERLQMNDNSIRTILELRDAFKRQRLEKSRT
jgi:hypothetical protein